MQLSWINFTFGSKLLALEPPCSCDDEEYRTHPRPGWRGWAGLGLVIARQLVEMHGGTIYMQSQKGEGSTFTIRLPIAGPDQLEQADSLVA